MERVSGAKLLGLELKYHQIYQLLIAAGMLAVLPMLAGITNLMIPETAKVIEFYAVWPGAVLLVPVFWPEREEELRDLVRAKYLDCRMIYLLRSLMSLVFILIWMAVLISVLYLGNCEFPVIPFFLGGMAGNLFLGGLGMAVHSMSGQISLGYMAPVMYFMGCIGGRKYFGNLYLFTLASGKYEEKWWLGAAGIALIILAVLWQKRKR